MGRSSPRCRGAGGSPGLALVQQLVISHHLVLLCDLLQFPPELQHIDPLHAGRKRCWGWFMVS